MVRPFSDRHVAGRPAIALFKPAGRALFELEYVVLSLDEFEALRLADLEGHYQTEAARQMKVSRATFSRIIEAAHQKVADALVHGKAIRIEGGPVCLQKRRCCRVHDAELPDAAWACQDASEITRESSDSTLASSCRGSLQPPEGE
ncbi:MAG: DUF134 domain-containing protein [Myxococcota bacterium]|jgi:predicted DNA-binding protein (UPF0251 family)|nr:DUF134 domain-containing protein [Myxococcota bacterium]